MFHSIAVGLPNIVPYLYYFWIRDIEQGYNGCHWLSNKRTGIETFYKYDNSNPNIKYFKQCIQSLIYALNQPYLRNSIQSAFTNFSIFDHYYAHALFDGVTFPDGSLAYDHIDNIVNLQVVVMDVIAEIRHVNVFTFPVLTFCLLKEGEGETTKFKDETFARWASDHNTQWFDSNFYISSTVDSLSNCCRLSSSIKDMMNDQGYFNSLGSSGLSVGSIKVNTINTANLAYQTVTETKLDNSSGDIIKNYFTNAEKLYIQKLHKQAKLNMMALDVIRDILTTNKEKRRLLPNIADGLIDMKHMYNTIGIIGVYETLKAFQNKLDELKNVLNLVVDKYDYIKYDSFGNTYYTTNAEVFAKKLFSALHDEIKAFRKEYKCNYSINVEQVPAETAAYKLMQKDELSYPDLVIKDLPLYGNQFIPLGIKTTLEERVRVAALFDTFLNGGSIAHLNFESTISKEQSWKYLNWIAQQGLTYSALTTKISACKHNHAFFGNICPLCGENAVTTYARIVGFYTSTGITPDGKETAYGSWSTTRKEEFRLRQWEEE
nr:anaerobic ribonucleoside reductase large subunit [uncultured phage]CAI9752317.1 anaerobic ribonucleoside reductase large subunit [uncultured phage]